MAEAAVLMRDLSCVPDLNFTFVEDYISGISKASGRAHISKGYKYFNEGYVHNITGKSQTWISKCKHTPTQT